MGRNIGAAVDKLVDHETYTFADLESIGGAVLANVARRAVGLPERTTAAAPPVPVQGRSEPPSADFLAP